MGQLFFLLLLGHEASLVLVRATATDGYSEIVGHTLGDPAQCTKGDQCGNIGGALKTGGGATCKADAAGHSSRRRGCHLMAPPVYPY